MLKKDEIENPDSCLNKAADDEPVFVLRAKDPAAAEAVRRWVSLRVGMRLNTSQDSKIIEAFNFANEMEAWLAESEERNDEGATK